MASETVTLDLLSSGRLTLGVRAADPFDVTADIAQGEDPGPWARAGATWTVTDFGMQPTQAQVREVVDKGPG